MILVAGHACLDLLPTLPGPLPEPGCLSQTGPLRIAGGGAVHNVGVALHRLGHPVRLVARVGDDPPGTLLRDVFRSAGPGLDAALIPTPGQPTSYTVVLSPPASDRRFLHCPGVNDAFDPSDLTSQLLAGCSHLHFGYPTMMRRFYSDAGQQLALLLASARHAGLSTSVDLTDPDPDSDAGRADWPAILARALPLTDYFCPSLPEARHVMRLPDASPDDLAGVFLRMGCRVVVLKDGARGLFLRSTDAAPSGWRNLRLHCPCFQVEVAGTTGSGDATIAGFLAALARGLPPEAALEAACAVGACCCEAIDATSGIQPWPATLDRIARGWPRLTPPA